MTIIMSSVFIEIFFAVISNAANVEVFFIHYQLTRFIYSWKVAFSLKGSARCQKGQVDPESNRSECAGEPVPGFEERQHGAHSWLRFLFRVSWNGCSFGLRRVVRSSIGATVTSQGYVISKTGWFHCFSGWRTRKRTHYFPVGSTFCREDCGSSAVII